MVQPAIEGATLATASDRDTDIRPLDFIAIDPDWFESAVAA
jgi:hypothetical protein